MSEVLDDYRKRKVDWEIKLSALSSVNRRLDSQTEILCCVEIPWPLLHLRHDVLEGISGKDSNYIELLNLTVVDSLCVLKLRTH